MDRFNFHCFWDFFGRYPPCLAIKVGSVGIGVALHVSRTVVVMLSVSVSNELQAICHCSLVKWCFCKSCISSSIWLEFLSKNFVRNSSRFFFGMGLSILGGGSEVVSGSLAIRAFGGMCNCMGKWSEFS